MSQASFTRFGGELRLSNRGQLELLRGMMERGVPLRATASGFSMLPFIRDGDLLTFMPFTEREPRVGAVVAFVRVGTGQLAVHRIIARVGEAWLIRADNSFLPDGIVPRENLLGVVVRVERNGRIIHVGLGPEARLIAWLAKHNLLRLVVRIGRLPGQGSRALLRHMGRGSAHKREPAINHSTKEGTS